MGVPVVIYGKSGAGKSRSLKNFGEDEILYVNVEGKRLPFRTTFKRTLVTDDVTLIFKAINKAVSQKVKTIVLDDVGLIMTHIFMAQHRNKSGSASFEMYDNIADTMYSLISFVQANIPDDVIVYFLMHEDTDDFGNTKLKTLGKLLDNKCQIAERLTIMIRCQSDNGKHFFRTVTDGSDITKSPEEMFSADEIENDLKAVDTAIREYYGMVATSVGE